MKAPIVGQTLYSLNVGNMARHTEQVLTPVIVSKVGRNFFYTGEDWRKQKYHLNTWHQETGGYSANSVLYESEQEYKDGRESIELCKTISKAFEYGRNPKGLSLQDLRDIKAIIEKEVK